MDVFVLQSSYMDERHFYQRPWFLLIFPPILVIVSYFLTPQSEVEPNIRLIGIVRDSVLYVVLLLIWLAFFAQFVLPVQGFRDRQKIFDHLLSYLTGAHGPAIFVRDGNPVKGEGEERKKGAGVLWLDSASALVTRTDTAFKNTFGPGVHFIENNERIAGYVDLHRQSHGVGPLDNEDPFANKSDKQTEETYNNIQARRAETSGLTRDGIEVVPKINVTFKIEADPVEGNAQPGSRFGFDETAVFLAIAGEAINLNNPKDSHRYRVPWNQLPVLIAVDVWRDLLGKFTLNDLFDPKYLLPPSIQNLHPSTLDNSASVNLTKQQGLLKGGFAGVLRELNHLLIRLSGWIDNKCKPKRELQPESPPPKQKKVDVQKEKKVTGLQLINHMLKERLQRQRTSALDPYGNYIPGQEQLSQEYSLLQSRGIRVLGVSVGNLRLPEEVNDKIIKQWTADWLNRARAEQTRLDQEDGYSSLHGEEETLRDYVLQLSTDLLSQVERGRATDLKGTLRALTLESRVILVSESRQYRQGSPERDALEEIIQWLETRDA